MKITYDITLADYKAAYRLVDRKTLFRRYELIIWPVIAVLSAFVVAGSNPRLGIYSVARLVFDFSAVLSIGLPLMRVFIPYYAFWRSYGSNSSTAKSTTEFSMEGITDVMPGVRTSSYNWSSVRGFAQDAKATVLYRKGFRFTFFPTPALSHDQLHELNELVLQHGIRRWSS